MDLCYDEAMRKLSPREAQRLGCTGGKESAHLGGRIGNREWGRRMRRIRGARTMRRAYPTLAAEWTRNAQRAARGEPLKPLPSVRLLRVEPSEVTVQRGHLERDAQAKI